MTDTLRIRLIGFALGALDEEEEQSVSELLQKDPSTHQVYAAVRAELQALRAVDVPYSPPEGLAERTVAAIWNLVDHGSSEHIRTLAALPVLQPVPVMDADTTDWKAIAGGRPSKTRSWLRVDSLMSVAIGLLLAVSMFPFLQHMARLLVVAIIHREIQKFEQQITVFPPDTVLGHDKTAEPYWRVQDSRTAFAPLQFSHHTVVSPPSDSTAMPVAMVTTLGGTDVGDTDSILQYLHLKSPQELLWQLGHVPTGPVSPFVSPHLDPVSRYHSAPSLEPPSKSHLVFVATPHTSSSPSSDGTTGRSVLHSGIGDNIQIRDGRILYRTIPATARQPNGQ